jgi:hypothetical protein
MHFTTATAVASGLILARTVVAQSYPGFDPELVETSLRTFWCQQQVSACPLLCGDRGTTTTTNECFSSNLYYACVCSDGKSPDLEKYSQTIPYFTCSHVVERCVDNCEGANLCAQKCRENKPCGAQGLPEDKNSTKSTKSTTSKTSTSLPTATDDKKEGDDFEKGFGSTDKEDDSKDSGASSMLSIKSSYGLATVIVGLAAGFTIFL